MTTASTLRAATDVLDDDLSRFRDRARQWLVDNAPAHGWDQPPPEDDDDARWARARQCQRLLLAAGFAGIAVPVEYGGQGLGGREQVVFDREASRYHLPLVPLMISVSICAPTLLAAGSEHQRRTYLPPLLRADEIWCQLFSEPGAGSDVASLTTRAVRDGDHFVVDGQKVWTSGAARCSHGLLLARTDVAASKHRGLTMFIVPMKTPGVVVRPLRQMNGAARFNEVFFESVRIPVDSVVGEIDGGWQAATSTLMTERVSIGGGSAGRDSHEVARLVAAAQQRGSNRDAVTRQALAKAVEREWIADLLVQRVVASVIAGRAPGPEGSLLKLAGTNRSQRAAELGARLAGADAVAWECGGKNRWADVMLAAPGLSIGGGTTEVHKNVVAERVLGLPREPRAGGTT